MKYFFLLLALQISVIVSQAQSVKIDYPSTHAVNHIDSYHGIKVADPYRWLENLDSTEVQDWVNDQNTFTSQNLQQLNYLDALKKRFTEIVNYTSVTRPMSQANRLFYKKNDGTQDHSVLYVKDNSESEEHLLIDPNLLSEDGSVSLSQFSPSPNAELLAYGISDSGSDWESIYVKNISTGKNLSDTISWVKFSDIIWTKDSKGFFYSRYDRPEEDALFARNTEHQLYYHKIGTSQSRDKLILRSEEFSNAILESQVTHNGQYVLVHQTQWPYNRTFLIDLTNPEKPDFDSALIPLFTGFEASYKLIGSQGSMAYFLTSKDAPNKRIIAVNLKKPGKFISQTIIPEDQSALIQADIIGNQFVVEYLEDAKSVIKFYTLEGQPAGNLPMPGVGSVSFGPYPGFEGVQDDEHFYYSFQSFTIPVTIYKYDFNTGKNIIYAAPKLVYDRDQYVTEQVFYESKDGTKVPMFITRNKNIEYDSNNPVMLYGYGGFGSSWPPAYAPFIPLWLELGGIWAWPNLRGGGEYGEAWHEAGMFDKKQNVFDDYIGAAEYLIKEKYTRSEKLGIFGASNGGLLVGAVLVQRPDLFKVALPDVGLYDMLRYHTFVAGHFGISEYGSSDSPEGFKYLYAYSPYHNVKKGTCYPAILITTADKEDRVPPLHSYKFAASLQEAQECENPVFLRVMKDAGHGSGTSLSKSITKYAEMWAFAAQHLGMEMKNIKN